MDPMPLERLIEQNITVWCLYEIVVQSTVKLIKIFTDLPA
jgi:hypothetical protein